jgi:RimJ/RimL family protein N-acetyltransferase
MNWFKKIYTPKYDIVDTNENDFNIIKNLFIEGVNRNCYEKNLTEDYNQFENMIKDMTNGKGGIDKLGRIALTLSCSIYQEKTIGFITLAIDENKKEIEIWYFSLLNSYQNKKLGSTYINILFKMLKREFPKYSLFARCKKSSIEMTKILNNNNFKITGKNKENYLYYTKQTI